MDFISQLLLQLAVLGDINGVYSELNVLGVSVVVLDAVPRPVGHENCLEKAVSGPGDTGVRAVEKLNAIIDEEWQLSAFED